MIRLHAKETYDLEVNENAWSTANTGRDAHKFEEGGQENHNRRFRWSQMKGKTKARCWKRLCSWWTEGEGASRIGKHPWRMEKRRTRKQTEWSKWKPGETWTDGWRGDKQPLRDANGQTETELKYLPKNAYVGFKHRHHNVSVKTDIFNNKTYSFLKLSHVTNHLTQQIIHIQLWLKNWTPYDYNQIIHTRL